MKRLLSILSLLIILLSSCKADSNTDTSSLQAVSDESYFVFEYSFDDDWTTNPFALSEDLQTPPPVSEAVIIPYDGDNYIELNGNKPYFNTSSLLPNIFMSLSPLDTLGRAGMAVCCVGKDTLNDGERHDGNLPDPSGWHSVQYDIISSKYLYHRCHL